MEGEEEKLQRASCKAVKVTGAIASVGEWLGHSLLIIGICCFFQDNKICILIRLLHLSTLKHNMSLEAFHRSSIRTLKKISVAAFTPIIFLNFFSF